MGSLLEKAVVKVLIVDDEDIICESLKMDFERFEHGVNYQVYTALSAIEAEKIYKKVNPEIIISDINMPKVNGLTMIDKIRSVDKTCKIFVLSAYDDFDYVRRSFLIGVNDYILKPISFNELNMKLKENLQLNTKYEEPDAMGVFNIEDAMDFMKTHINEEISMSDVAQRMSVSYNYFSKLFRKHTGMNFPNYLLMLRMEKAKEYLNNPSVKINLIAQKVGYRYNPHHFSRDFSKYTGMSPKEYRKNKCISEELNEVVAK